MTISPPLKRQLEVTERGCVLGAGVDRLVLAVDLVWRNDDLFRQLAELKNAAIERECTAPGLIRSPEHGLSWAFQVHPYGLRGYQWLLTSPEYAVHLGNWARPRSRPSAMIDIHSETLWMQGVVESIDNVLCLVNSAGGTNEAVKASRIDLCLDLLIPAGLWNAALSSHAVSRARNKCHYETGRLFNALEFGRGDIRCRMYDKALEIRTKSKKTWFYDVWQIPEVPENARAIRVEFQLRREALKELGINSVWDFTNRPRNLWAYCVREWLKFTDNPSTETRFQHVLPFWKTVQDGFFGSQDACPLIRAKAINIKKKQLAQQLLGQLTSLMVIDTDEFAPQVKLAETQSVVTESAKLLGIDDKELSERVRQKQGRYLKAIEKFREAEKQRKALGLPTRTAEKGEAA
jgi:hypothetical protein